MPQVNPINVTAEAMLGALQQAHAVVRSCIQEMEVVTSASSPDRLKYTEARLRISRASTARRACLSAILCEILESPAEEEKATIGRVQEADRALLQKSARLVSQWTPEAIAADWRGYRAASRQIRRHMVAELEIEENLLFPLLTKRSSKLVGCTPRRAA
jgi:hypothetical protein